MADVRSVALQAVVPNVLKAKLMKGELAHSFSIKIISNVEIIHYAAVAGYDAVLIDLEHSQLSLSTASQLSVVANQVGVTPIVRVPTNSSEWISRSLDGGAGAVIVPHVNTAAEAERVVRHAKFAPLGQRSATNGMPILRYASVQGSIVNEVVNDATVVICMIESLQALKNVDSIAAVPGVDVLLVGSSDLTTDMGIPNDYGNERLVEAYATVAAAAKNASTTGRLVSVGIGGLSARPDLIQKFATLHPNARYAMSGGDNTLLLKAMRESATHCQVITQSLL